MIDESLKDDANALAAIAALMCREKTAYIRTGILEEIKRSFALRGCRWIDASRRSVGRRALPTIRLTIGATGPRTSALWYSVRKIGCGSATGPVGTIGRALASANASAVPAGSGTDGSAAKRPP